MKNYIAILFFVAFLCASLGAQSLYKSSYRLQSDGDGKFSGRLHGNGVIDLLVQDNAVYAATGYGLNRTLDNGDTWQTFYSRDYKGKGGVSAMQFMKNGTLWIATAYDTTIDDDDLPVGGGLSYTQDGGETWTHIPQPVDSVGETDYAPTTTTVQNLTYDIAFVHQTVWIASFGGGLRRSDDMGETWQVVTTDGVPFSSSAHLNHRAFSLLSVHDTLWVGTAEGLSMSPDNGQSWQRFVHDPANTDSTISGNFVVALAHQPATGAVWAATIEARGATEKRAVSFTRDAGQSWQRVLIDESIFAHNFAFDGENIFIPSDKGLYYTLDNMESWQTLPDIQDARSRDEIFLDEYYAAAVQERLGELYLWFGASDGLAVTQNYNFDNWRVIRSYVTTEERPDPAIYAYPSPFSPSRHEYIRFEFDQEKPLDEAIKIYDFAMDYVATVPSTDFKPKWNGTNDAGDTVASGVYFFRAKVGGEITWGKIVVIN